MEIAHRLEDVKPDIPSVVTVGVFDGVHLGHQAIMRMVKVAARGHQARSAVVTFDGNPEAAIHPESAPPSITTLNQKLDLIARQGMDLALVLPVDRSTIEMPAMQFVLDILCEKLNTQQVVVGKDFQFGKGKVGNVNLLREMGKELGFGVIAVASITVGEVQVSSTAIRQLISEGAVEDADEMLGHPFALAGTVVPGQGIGQALGFPTANIRPAENQILPRNGVYAVTVNPGRRWWVGVANIGTRPTVGGMGTTVEVYIIGFSGNIYGQELEVAFHHRIRDERKFPDTDALRGQISRDVEQALRLLE